MSELPAGKASRYGLARLVGGHICIHACMAGMRMASPLLALRDGYSAASVGVLLSLFALTQVFLSLPAGRFADRHGLKRPVAISVIASALGAFIAFLFPVFPVLCLSALVTGGATGAASIALQRHVGRSAENTTELKRLFSWLSIGPAVSNFVGPLAAGLLIDHAGVWLGGQAADTNGYRGAFLLMALLPLATWFWIRHTLEMPGQKAADALPTRAWDLLREPMMRRLMVVNWLMASCWDVHTFVVPIIGHERGMSASAIGAILGGFAIAATVVRSVMPMFASRLREGTVVSTAMGATAALFFVYPFMNTPLAMGICSMLLGLSLGSVQPMIMSTLHQITPPNRHGEALGLRLVAINASSVVMPLVFGAAGAVVGISGVFWCVGVVAGLGTRTAHGLRPPD